MPSRIRFPTARAVFETYRDLATYACAGRRSRAARTRAAASASKRSVDAILSWRSAPAPRGGLVGAPLRWGHSGAERRRRGASRRGCVGAQARRRKTARRSTSAPPRSAGACTTWLALAAGWLGKSRSAPEQKPMPPQPSACARAANAAVILAITTREPSAIPPADLRLRRGRAYALPRAAKPRWFRPCRPRRVGAA